MTIPPYPQQTGTAMRDDLRVSDADRDRAAAQLGHHFAVGRLTHSELDDRLGAALTATTARDLKRVLADLPLARNEQLELRYRRLIALYPARYRRVHQDEILAVLMTAAPADSVRPTVADAADLILGAIRVRYQLARQAGMSWRRAVALTVAGGLLGVMAGSVIALASPPQPSAAEAILLRTANPTLDYARLSDTLDVVDLRVPLARAATLLGPPMSLGYLQAHTYILPVTDQIVVFRVQAATPALAVRATSVVTESCLTFLARRWSPQVGPAHVLDVATIVPGESLTGEIARDACVAAAFSVMVAASGSLVLMLNRPRRLSAS
jgi:Domain of unknown function (DUF1707)